MQLNSLDSRLWNDTILCDNETNYFFIGTHLQSKNWALNPNEIKMLTKEHRLVTKKKNTVGTHASW